MVLKVFQRYIHQSKITLKFILQYIIVVPKLILKSENKAL